MITKTEQTTPYNAYPLDLTSRYPEQIRGSIKPESGKTTDKTQGKKPEPIVKQT